jgi:hypothetical protein
MKKTALLDKTDLARELGISPSRVLYHVKHNNLPCCKLSRRTLRFDLQAVRRWYERLPNLGKTEKQRRAEEHFAKKAKMRAEERIAWKERENALLS